MLLKMRQERLGGGCVVIQDDSLISIHARGGYLINRMKLSTWSLLMYFITGFLITDSLNLKVVFNEANLVWFIPAFPVWTRYNIMTNKPRPNGTHLRRNVFIKTKKIILADIKHTSVMIGKGEEKNKPLSRAYSSESTKVVNTCMSRCQKRCMIFPCPHEGSVLGWYRSLKQEDFNVDCKLISWRAMRIYGKKPCVISCPKTCQVQMHLVVQATYINISIQKFVNTTIYNYGSEKLQRTFPDR